MLGLYFVKSAAIAVDRLLTYDSEMSRDRHGAWISVRMGNDNAGCIGKSPY